jgi:hypothetical protein
MMLMAVPSEAAMHPRRPVLKEMDRRSLSVSATSAEGDEQQLMMWRSGSKRSGCSQTRGLRPRPVRLRMTWLPLGTWYPATVVSASATCGDVERCDGVQAEGLADAGLNVVEPWDVRLLHQAVFSDDGVDLRHRLGHHLRAVGHHLRQRPLHGVGRVVHRRERDVLHLRLHFLDRQQGIAVPVPKRDEHVEEVLHLILLPLTGLPLPPPPVDDGVVQPVDRLVGLLHELLVAVQVQAQQTGQVVRDAERVEQAQRGEHGLHVLHLRQARPTVGLRLAEVAPVEEEPADDVAAVVARHVPHVHFYLSGL